MEEPGRLQSMGSLMVGHDWMTSLSRIGEGIGNPLQCSWLENPRDGGAWWAMGSQSRTRLKWLSSSSNSALWVSQVVLVKNPSANAGDETCGFNPCAGRSPEEGNGNPLQSFSLENPMDRAWWAIVHRVTKSDCINLAQLSFSELTFPYKQGPHSQWSPGNSAWLPVRYCTQPTDCFPLKDSCH